MKNILSERRVSRIRSFCRGIQWKLGYQWNPFVDTVCPKIDPFRIRQQLETLGITVHSIRVNLQEYDTYVKAAHYPEDYYGGGLYPGCNFEEKALEHFMSIKCLEITSSDIVLDVAALTSPFSDIVKQMYGCVAYKLDQTYVPGVHGATIGSNAVTVPLPDNSASKIVLHCSFEHFENDRDIIFMKEADRLLCKHGKLCILPIHFGHADFFLTDPCMSHRGIRWMRGEKVVYLRNFRNRYARFYSPHSFKKRIMGAMDNLSLKMFYVENNEEAGATTNLKFIALFEKR